MHANPATPACSHAARHRACSSLRLAPFVNFYYLYFSSEQNETAKGSELYGWSCSSGKSSGSTKPLLLIRL